MRSWSSILDILVFVLPLAAFIGLPSAAHAERWYGTGEVCMDLDSVRIINNGGARYVAFRQQLCSGSGILWWAVADSDCDTVRGKDTSSVTLYVYDADARQWRTVFDYFNFPQPLEDEYTNAGVACNWAHPQFP